MKIKEYLKNKENVIRVVLLATAIGFVLFRIGFHYGRIFAQ